MLIEIFIKRTHFHEKSGGLETQSKELAEGLVRLGYEVNVISPKYELTMDQTVEANVKYTFLNCWFTHNDAVKSGFKKDSWDKLACDYYKKTNPNLVISQSSAGWPIIKLKNRVPVISIAHGTILREFRTYFNKNGFSNPIELIKTSQFVMREYFGKQKNFINQSDFVVTVSEDVKVDLLKETNVDPNKLKVIYVGVDSKRFLQPNINNSDSIKLVYVGVLIKEKGIEYTIKALSELKNKFPDITLTIVGDGPDKEYFESVVDSLNLTQKIKFLGRVNYSQIPTILNKNNIFVHPTVRDEGFPMSILEAVTAGLCVIATDKGGTRNVVKSGINGILINPQEEIVIQLIEAITFVKDGMMLNQMSNESLKIANEFSFEKVIKQYDEIIKNLTGK